MPVHVVEPGAYERHRRQIVEMHRLRYRVFHERMGWEVETIGDLEADRFDLERPYYLLNLDAADGRVIGCARLLPTTGRHMLRDVFPELLDGRPPIEDPRVYESSRFAVDTSDPRADAKAGLEMFLALMEFGLKLGLSQVVTVTDLRVERLAKRAGVRWTRLGKPQRIGVVDAVAGVGEISAEGYEEMRRRTGVTQPVIAETASFQGRVLA